MGMCMKIFLDTADRKQIEKFLPTGLIEGVTTNPSLLSKENPSSVREVIVDICKMIPDGEVSVEIVQESPDDIYTEALEIAAIHENVIVKIPFHRDYLSIIHRLSEEAVDINVTLVFSALQALMVANLDVTYISPFVGRLDDIGGNGVGLIEDIADMIETYEFDSEVLAASIRSVDHWKKVLEAGADVVTLPPAILEKAMEHPLTTKGIEMFSSDWKKLGKKTLL
jgi:transaldolase